MGPTCFLHGSHTESAHAAYNKGQPHYEDMDGSAAAAATTSHVDTSEWSCLLRDCEWSSPLLGQGDCVLFDSRLMHFGSENSSDVEEAASSAGCYDRLAGVANELQRGPKGKRRVLFYVSLRARGSGSSWTGCGFDKPGTLLNDLRGRYRLDRGQKALEDYFCEQS